MRMEAKETESALAKFGERYKSHCPLLILYKSYKRNKMEV